MNERILELRKQAGVLGINDITGLEGDKLVSKFLEKFAELIIRECLLCCERTISDPVPKSVDTFEQGGIHCMDEIKQHFGVEE